jgi:hypothetical protein
VAVIVMAASGVSHARDDSVPPKRQAKLLAWLETGVYREIWTPEPAAHPSTGPHGGNVRTYYNPILVEDLRAGRTVFSKKAAMVKELYGSSGEQVIGYAVMRKVRRRSGGAGRGWLFYETFDVATGRGFYGRGQPLCAGCHATGVDFLQSPFRP